MQINITINVHIHIIYLNAYTPSIFLLLAPCSIPAIPPDDLAVSTQNLLAPIPVHSEGRPPNQAPPKPHQIPSKPKR